MFNVFAPVPFRFYWTSSIERTSHLLPFPQGKGMELIDPKKIFSNSRRRRGYTIFYYQLIVINLKISN